MPYFAKVEDSIVTTVIVADQAFIDTQEGTWVETKKDGSIRKNYAGPGFTYDSVKDAFIPNQRWNTWILNESTCRWEPPIAEPNPNPDADGNHYDWDDALYESDNTKGWIKVPNDENYDYHGE